MTLDTFVEADILATCNALGSEVKGEYHKGAECLDCLKDILRYLKRDGENHEVLRCLGSVRLLQTDLLPILKKYHDDPEIFDFTLRILVSLTTPALLMYKEDLPDDKISRNEYLQLVSYLQSYKVAFIDVDAWKVLFGHLKTMLNMRPLERSTDESLVIERIIILVRNVLHVPPDESILKQTDDDISVHDKVLLSLRSAQMDVLLLYMCANQEEHQYCLHLLEIVFLMMREHTAEVLAVSNEVRSETEKQKDLEALQAARQREQALKQRLQTVCKPRFSGVYCIKNMKSLSDNDLISYKYVSNVGDIHFDSNKNARRRPKNRARAPDVDTTRHSTLNIRLFLKNFCQEFLKAYNKLMVSVKRELMRKVSEEHDETYYFWAVRYFMQFNRLCDFQPALVSETVSTQTFHHVQTEITNYQEMMLTDKKKQKFWAKRMQLGVGAYKELLETLRKMERSPDEAVRECADALIGHIFYVIEYRELLLSLLTHYDEVKFPLSYLAELVESTQLFLKMLENHSKKHSEIVVQQKQRKIRKRKKSKKVNNPELGNEDELLQQKWDEVISELSEGVRGHKEVPSITAFDAASELPFEEQKVEAVFKIREALMANKPLEALGLLRASRDLWPEQDTFGASDIDPESELSLIKEIHFSNLKRNTEQNPVPLIEEASDEEEDEERESLAAVTEKSLNLDDVYKKYATPKVIMPCSLLLANYRNNKPETNMCLVKLFHRIAWNCKMHAMFFQSTIFLTFQKIFHDPDANHDPVIKELYRFARFIVQKFFAAAEKNKKIFVEMLFWKGPREAYEIEEGYGTAEQKNKGWTEDDEEELRYLYEENKDIHIEGQDVADIILANFNKKCTKPQIISALKRLGLIKSAKDLKPEKRSEWLEAEIVDLQHLFEDFKDSEDVMGNILERLSIKRSRKAVIEKLLELNLIQDRKEVRKRKSKKKPKEGESSGDRSSEESDQSSESSEEEGNSDEDEINFFRNLRAELDNAAPDSEQPLDSLMPVQTAKKAKKPPKVWDEQEVMELILIFNENSDANNLMDIIQKRLTVKRKEKDVIQKLLELGLIKNENEVRSKKASKPKDNGRKKNKYSYPDNASDSDDLVSPKGVRKSKQSILSDDSEQPSDSSTPVQTAKKAKKPPKVWDEQEVMELILIFNENSDSDNLMDIIQKGLTLKRKENDVIQKLLELGLINSKDEVRSKKVGKQDKSKDNGRKNKKHSEPDNASDSDDLVTPKGIRKSKQSILSDDSSEEGHDSSLAKTNKKSEKSFQASKKKRPPKIWGEQEVMELTSLFHTHQGSKNIMQDILDGLTIKRPKKAVTEKLLELRLIEDKKELRKKRESKANARKSDGELLSKSGSKRAKKQSAIDSDDSDEDVPLSAANSRKSDGELLSKSGNKRSKKQSAIDLDDSDEDVPLSAANARKSGGQLLSQLSNKRSKQLSAVDSGDDVPLSAANSRNSEGELVGNLLNKRSKKQSAIDSGDSDEDVPLSAANSRKSESELVSKSGKRLNKQSAIDSDEDAPLSAVVSKDYALNSDSVFQSSLKQPMKTDAQRRKKNRARIFSDSSDEGENLTKDQDNQNSYSKDNRAEDELTQIHARQLNHRMTISGASADDIFTEDQNEHSVSKSNAADSQNFKSLPNGNLEKKNSFRQRMISDSSDEDVRDNSKDNNANQITKDNQKLQSGKRKITVISSDESGEETSKEPVTVLRGEEYSEVLTVTKAKAKKKFILEDSDDTS